MTEQKKELDKIQKKVEVALKQKKSTKKKATKKTATKKAPARKKTTKKA